ncbi:MAG: hypothetical protein ABSC56_12050 [Solirubrobacteraceae bacterium]|jgi:hypothetical protein
MNESDSDCLREATLAAFDRQHRAAYGSAPAAMHAWIESGAILVVARAQAALEARADRSLAASLAELQHAILADIYLRTGRLLRPGGRSANSERGLLVLAFERVPASALTAARGSAPRAPLAG